jgi:hypothetical protein
MNATHLNCPGCGTIRPIRFEPLLAGEPALGTRVSCAHCGRHAFTLLRPARFYCDLCDEVRPTVLERMELPTGAEFAVVLLCGGCFDTKAVLFASARPGRFAGAGASGRPVPAPPSGRARRG